MAKEVYDLVSGWSAVDKAVTEYRVKAAEAASQKLFETASIETTISLLSQVETRLTSLQARKDALGERASYMAQVSFGNENPELPSEAAQKGYSGDTAAQHVKALEQQAAGQEHLLELQHQQNVLAIDERHIKDGSLPFYARVAAEQKKAQEISAEGVRLEQATQKSKQQQVLAVRELLTLQGKTDELEKYPVPAIDPHAGESKAKQQDAIASGKADAERIERQRELDGEMRHLRSESAQAGLEGVELEHQKLVDAEAEMAAKLKLVYGGENSAYQAALGQRTALMEEAYRKRHGLELEEEERRVAERQLEASAAGLTGMAAIQARGASEVGKIQSDHYKDYDPVAGYSAHAEADRVSAREKTNAEMAREQKRFDDEMTELSDSTAMREISGFARIHAEAAKELDGLKHKFDDTYGKMDLTLTPNRDIYQHGVGQYNTGEAAIRSSEKSSVTDLARKNANETLKIQEEAARKSMPIEWQQTREAYDQYNERTRAYAEMLRKQEISQEDFNKRVAAAGQELQGELKRQQKEAQDKLAGELTSLFKNPAKFIQNLGEKAMGQAAASMLMRVPGVGDTIGKRGITGFLDPSQYFSGGAHNPKLKTAGGVSIPQHGVPELAGTASTASTLSIGTATIHVGSASIIGSGGTSGPGFVSGGAKTLSSGSTIPGSTGGGSGAPGESSAPGMGQNIGTAMGTTRSTLGLLSTAAPKVGAGNIAPFANADEYAMALSNQKPTGTFPSADPDEYGKMLSASTPHTVMNSTSAWDKSLLGGGGFKQNSGGMIGGGMGLFGAYESQGGFGGMMGGALAGAKLGMAVGGPMGMAVGAAAGAVMGEMGFGGRAMAKKYDEKQVGPRLEADQRSFDEGSMDYLSAYSDLDSLESEAQKTVSKWGPGATSYFNDTIKKEIISAQSKMTREARAGRAQYSFSAAQFHTGGEVDSFGNLATSPSEGLVHAEIGDFIVKPNVASKNRSALQAMNAGASMDTIAANYRNTMSSRDAQRSAPGGDRTVHMNFYSLDSKSVARMFHENAHHIRAALNQSYAEYSGGSDV
jgi:hypothetical protein